MLIQAGANAKAKDRYGFTPLYFAATNGNAAIIRKLLEAGADPNAADADGETALMTATRSGNVDALKVLLQNGANVNAKDSVTQQTALMWAARSHFAAAVPLLLEYGAEVNAQTRKGKTPAPRPPGAGGGSHGVGIVRSGWPEQGFQGETPGGMTPLLYASRDGRLDIARLLVAAKADVQQADVNGITPLLMAITNNHLDVAKFLLEKAADPNAADWWGRTPLYAAVEIRNRDYGRNDEHAIDRPGCARPDPGAAGSRRECECTDERSSSDSPVRHAAGRSILGRFHRADAVPAGGPGGRYYADAPAAR